MTPGSCRSFVFHCRSHSGYSVRNTRQRLARVDAPRFANREYLIVIILSFLSPIYMSLLSASLRQRQAADLRPPHVARRVVGWFSTPELLVTHTALRSGTAAAQATNRVGVVRLLSPTPLMPGLAREGLRRRSLPTIIHVARATPSELFACVRVSLREISIERRSFLARVSL